MVSDCIGDYIKNSLFNQMGALMKKIFYYFKSRKVRIAVLIAALSMVACMAGMVVSSDL